MSSLPNYKLGSFRFRAGKPRPFGATVTPDGINFSIFSCYATSCSLVLFKKGADLPMVEIPFLESFRTGDVYAMTVLDLDPAEIEYGFRLDGPFDPANGHRFNAQRILLDPYAKSIGGLDKWGESGTRGGIYPYRARPHVDDFDWEGDRQLNIPLEDLSSFTKCIRVALPRIRPPASTRPALRRDHRENPLPERSGRQLHRTHARLRV